MEIIGFYHIGIIGRWSEIYKLQKSYLKETGLYDKTSQIYIGTSGNDVRDTLDLDDKMKIVCVENNINYGETKTIKTIYDYSCNRTEPCKIWYIHTKGASYTKPEMIEIVDSWRNYLEYFVIGKHDKCESMLDNYDACGTEFCNKNFFSGNFWWANSDYIKTIDLKGLWLNGYSLGTWKSKRHLAEQLFVGSGSAKIFNFITIFKKNNCDAYSFKINPHQYKNVL